MEQIWAPWRINYIAKHNDDNKGCIFCNKPKENNDIKNLILFRNSESYVIMNLYPYNSGHLLVTVYEHKQDLQSLSQKQILDLMETVNKSIFALNKTIKPDGFNIGINMGDIAGAGIKDHIHLHIVPRWKGDTNFMPVISDTKVINEDLNHLYLKLKEYF